MKIARTLQWHNAKCQLPDAPLNAISTHFSQVRQSRRDELADVSQPLASTWTFGTRTNDTT